MRLIFTLFKRLRKLHRLSKIAIFLGGSLTAFLYIIAGFAYWIAPGAADYLYAISIHYGAMEAAPAGIAVGVCAGLLGDLMLRRGSDEDLG